jgi:hypothetical protein
MSRQKTLFKDDAKKLSDDEIEALGVKFLGNVYYYYPEQIKKLIIAVEKRLRGIHAHK